MDLQKSNKNVSYDFYNKISIKPALKDAYVYEQDVLNKRLKKRIALRNLLVSKFRNKYFAQDSEKDELNVYI